MIFCHACAEKMGERIFLIGRAQDGWTRLYSARGPERGEAREFVG